MRSPEELAALATALRDEIAPSRPGQQAHIVYEPYGVVLAIAPWNGPMTLGLRAVANPIVRVISDVVNKLKISGRWLATHAL